MTPQAQVHEFELADCQPVPGGEVSLKRFDGDRRVRLVREEVAGVRSALDRGDLIRVINALGSTLYAAYGSAVAMGVDLGCDHSTVLHRSEPPVGGDSLEV